MKRFLKFLKQKRSLRIRFLIIFLVLIYIPMALNIYFVYKRTIDAVEKEKIKANEQILKKTSETIDFTFRSIEEAVFEIANQNGIRKGLDDFDNLSGIYQEKILNFIKRRFETTKEDNIFIEEFLCVPMNGKSFSHGGNISIDFEGFLKSNLYKRLATKENEVLWQYVEGDSLFLNSEDKKLFFLVYKIKSIDMERDVGYLFAFLNLDRFESLYNDILLGETGNITMYDKEKEVVLGQAGDNINKNILSIFISEKRYYNMKEVEIANNKYFVGVAPLTSANWYIGAIVPGKELTGSIKSSLMNSMWFVGIISAFLAIWIVIEIVILSDVITEKEMAKYRLALTEEMNGKLRIYKHDFMNHLQIVRGLIELDYPDRALDYLKSVTKEGLEIKHKYEIGIPELESTIFTAISDAMAKNIDVEIEAIKLPPKLPVKIYDLTKILSNLFKNAIQALENTKAHEKKLKIKIYEELGEYVFEVINNIPVIPEEIKDKIFTRGFSTKGKDGMGLGLYIVRKMVHRNRGNIKLVVDREGNHFIVKFPYC